MSGENAIEATPTGAPAPHPAAGWWPSSWSATEVAAGKVSRGGLQTDGGSVYWTESRPNEGGRQVVVGRAPGAPPRDLSPSGVSVRSRVHEYGGGAATVVGGVLFYVDESDQAWHRLVLDGDLPPSDLDAGSPVLDPSGAGAVRYADGRLTVGGRWFLTVEERIGAGCTDHRIVALPTDGRAPAVPLCVEDDFVAAPRPSPDGRWLAWVGWNHPSMPWDSSSVWVAPFAEDAAAIGLGARRLVAGGDGIAVGQPRWCRDGSLLLVDDRNGWWLPYRVAPSSWVGVGSGGIPTGPPLVDLAAEFHGPDWAFGQATLAERDDGSIAARMRRDGRDDLVLLRPGPGGPLAGGWTVSVLEQPCVTLAGVACLPGGAVVVLGSTATEAQVVLGIDPSGERPPRRLSDPPRVTVPVGEVSVARPVPPRSGGHSAPGQFFAPVNPAVDPATGAPPPLVVFCHGGPTGAAEAGYDPVVQFFTSRGIAVAAVDYRGSTGYGRAYRDQLRGRWGEDDVDDCVACAEALAREGRVDGSRMAIRGTSAGGLTALGALVRSRRFAGAVAWYGVTDLEALAADTHDFESRYLDGLVGPLPEAAALYRARSPIHHPDRVSGRVLLLQGADDPVVPASQSEGFAARLADAGVDCRLVVFAGESHGFRRAETIEVALELELSFYRSLFTPGATPDPDDRGRDAALRGGPRAG